MATEAPATATRPARTRTRPAATTSKAAAKPAPAKAAPAKVTEVTRFTVVLEHVDTTKSYEKFAFPADVKGVVVGNVYAPIGTAEVKVLIVGADDAGDTE